MISNRRRKGILSLLLLRLRNYFKSNNKYDFLVIITIASLAWGNLEYLRAITPVRIMGCVGLYYGFHNMSLLIRQYKSLIILFAFWSFYMIMSLTWTSDMALGVAMVFHMTTMFGAFMLLFVSSIKAKRFVYSLTTGWILMVVATMPIAIWEILTFDHLSSGSFQEGSIDKSGDLKIYAAVTFQNYNSYVVMLSFAMPFIILSFWQRNRTKWIYAFVALLMCFVLFINSSRGGLLCMSATILVLYYEYAKRQKIFTVAIQILIIFAVFAHYVINNIDDINFLHSMLVRFSDYDVSTMKNDSRLAIWAVGFEIAANHFFGGTGIGSMIKEYAEIGKNEIHYAHNYYLELLIEDGLIISCTYFGLFYRSLMRMKQKINNRRIRLLAIHMIVCSVIIFVIDDYYTVRSGAWLFVASVISMQKRLLTRKSMS